MNLIKEIHESELFGIIIETGCSTALSSKLMGVEGASKTIFKCEQPYAKEQQKLLYGDTSKSVSKEFVDRVLDVEKEKITDNRINFIIASSWQLDKDNPSGWIGVELLKTGNRHVFHFSFEPNGDYTRHYNHICNNSEKEHKNIIRTELINEIGDIGLNILYSSIDGLNQIECGLYSILDIAYKNNLIDYELLFNTLNNAKSDRLSKDYFLTFVDGKPIRFVDLMRKSNVFVVNKGSFDPIHAGHLKIMEMGMEHEKTDTGIFAISINRYDKPKIELHDLMNRIKEINDKGYPVVINKRIYFYDMFDLFDTWGNGKQIKSVIGVDTINRIYDTDIDDFEKANETYYGSGYKPFDNFAQYLKEKTIWYKKNFKFLLYPRLGYERKEETHLYDDMIEVMENYHDDGISSTKIRNSRIKS